MRRTFAITTPRLTLLVKRRKCCKRTLATNCVPGYGWQATMALQDRLSKPEVRHYCVYRSLLCSTPSIVFIARFCVQRPLLCLSPTRWQVTKTLPSITMTSTIVHNCSGVYSYATVIGRKGYLCYIDSVDIMVETAYHFHTRIFHPFACFYNAFIIIMLQAILLPFKWNTYFSILWIHI